MPHIVARGDDNLCSAERSRPCGERPALSPPSAISRLGSFWNIIRLDFERSPTAGRPRPSRLCRRRAMFLIETLRTKIASLAPGLAPEIVTGDPYASSSPPSPTVGLSPPAPPGPPPAAPRAPVRRGARQQPVDTADIEFRRPREPTVPLAELTRRRQEARSAPPPRPLRLLLTAAPVPPARVVPEPQRSTGADGPVSAVPSSSLDRPPNTGSSRASQLVSSARGVRPASATAAKPRADPRPPPRSVSGSEQPVSASAPNTNRPMKRNGSSGSAGQRKKPKVVVIDLIEWVHAAPPRPPRPAPHHTAPHRLPHCAAPSGLLTRCHSETLPNVQTDPAAAAAAVVESSASCEPSARPLS
jgi:hypothetical protein